MAEPHERYEQQAVGHVLGGLDAADAAEFRDHLLGCRACRSRVAELRGIAADLAAAEREERSRAPVRTELPRRADEDEASDPGPPPRLSAKHVTVVAIVVALLAGAMGFWNLHLRTQVATYGAVVENQAVALGIMAAGVPVPAETWGGVDAAVAVTDDEVAFALAELPTFAIGDVLVVWLEGGDLETPVPALYARANQLDGGEIAGSTAQRGAAELTIRRERGEPGEEPGGDELVHVSLRPLDDEA